MNSPLNADRGHFSLIASDYAHHAAAHDEMWLPDPAVDGEGQPRDFWRPLIHTLDRLGGAELERRRQEGRQLLRENGVTYNLYNQPEAPRRGWDLDPVPLLISQQEWQKTETALTQRAELFNLILRDLYGERRLLREGLMPAELVFRHSGFLRPCQSVTVPGPHQLLLYAADLARGADGQLWVMNDRAQAPSGAGYALETRIALARILPNAFRDGQVRRLAQFFRTLRNTLARLAPREREDPRVVLLTAGPYSETYFEHAYLASYLGYNLVVGDDLTVRDSTVWMKSLDGLKPVDVILRRLDDDYCDPLELLENSRLGVPGLLEAARRGKVAIANPLGSGLLENPGLLPFLPRLARVLLDQELQLPSANSWWCGDEKSRRHVLDNLDRLLIKPINRRIGSIFGPELSRSQLQGWRDRIERQPHLYVGQEPLAGASTPSLVEGRLQPCQVVTRTFLVSDGDGYAVMPGGLTRIAPSHEMLQISNQTGGTSKDTWVLADRPQPHVSLLPPDGLHPSALERQGVLPSRAGENLFWVGRYAERAEFTIRLLRNVALKLDEIEEYQDQSDRECLYQLLRALTEVTHTHPGFVGEESQARLLAPQEEIFSLVLDEERVGGISQILRALVQAAFNLRDLWTSDTWRVIDEIEKMLESMQNHPAHELGRLQAQLDRLVTVLLALTGQTTESMTHEHGWMLLDIGRRLERGINLIDLIRTTLVQNQDEIVRYLILERLLSVQESLIIHRWRYRTAPQLATALELLLLDTTNPRALIYQLRLIEQHLTRLPGHNPRHPSKAERITLEVFSQLRLCDTLALATPDETGHQQLDQLLHRLGQGLGQLSVEITQLYFSLNHPQSEQLLSNTLAEQEV